MDLDARQTRGIFLAGTVPFPSPFPSIGTIALTVGHLTYSPGERPRDKELVIVHYYCRDRTVSRVMLQEDVSAIFVPGVRKEDGIFRISCGSHVDDLEQGEWFLDTDVNTTAIRGRLRLRDEDDIATHSSILRGIVYIAEDRPILHITEIALTAGADDALWFTGCTSCYIRGCTPC